MTIRLLERPPALDPPVDGGVPCGAVPAAEGAGLVRQVRQAEEAVERAVLGASGDATRAVPDQPLGELVAALARVESRAAWLRLRLAAEADRRRVAERTAETGTDAWLARLTGSTRAQAAGGLRLARLLHERYTATREAFAAGRLRVEQVRVIVQAAEQSPAEATPAQVAAAEQWLVDRATGDATRSGRPIDARRLRQSARRMFAHLDHDLALRHEAILLGRESRTAEVETFLSVHDNGDGTYSGRFRVPELTGQLLTAALQRLTSPRRLGRDRRGALVTDVSAPGTANGVNIYESWGAAFCELLEHLPTRGWPGHGGNHTELLVTIDLSTLVNADSGLGSARLDTGTAITAGEARRLACGAGLIPAVLGGSSRPLDLGRTRRLHSRTQRRAYALLHDSCAVAGCERPFAWCEIHHHELAWSRGGRTDLSNGLPLCGHHHRRAHDPAFDLRRRPDGEWAFHRRT